MSKATLHVLEQEIEARGLDFEYAEALVDAALGKDNEVQVFSSAIECLPFREGQDAPSTIIALSALTLKQRITAARETLGIDESEHA